jgi:hypothetical protein
MQMHQLEIEPRNGRLPSGQVEGGPIKVRSKMSHQTGPDEIPEFKASLPEHLLASLSEQDRWLHERVDIAAQQTAFILRVQNQRRIEFNQHVASDTQEFSAIKSGIAAINIQLTDWDKFKVMLTSKWSVVAFLFGTIIFPLAVVVCGSWIKERMFDDHKPQTPKQQPTSLSSK